jgi:hypothetical protein
MLLVQVVGVLLVLIEVVAKCTNTFIAALSHFEGVLLKLMLAE